MAGNAIGWFEIYVDDMDRAQAFYEAVFEVKLQTLEMPDMVMRAFPMNPEASGASGSLVKMDHMGPGGGGTMVYFNCGDSAVEAKRAAEHGGAVVQEKMSIGEFGFIALVNDTEGNTIGLHSMR